MDNNSRINGLIGLAARAGKIKFGSETILRAKPVQIKLVIIAEDLHPASIVKLSKYAEQQHISYFIYLTKHALGALLGKHEIGAFALSDVHLAQEIKNIMKAGDLDG